MSSDWQRREAARELLGRLDNLGISQVLRDVTVRLDRRLEVSVGDRLLLGCWDGINKGLENYASLRGKDISTPEKRQALVELLTENYARGLIAREYGFGIENFRAIEL